LEHDFGAIASEFARVQAAKFATLAQAISIAPRVFSQVQVGASYRNLPR
jgi:hypothetical protein